MALRIVATEAVPVIAERAFAGLGTIAVDTGHDSSVLNSAEVLIVRTRRVDAELLDQTPYLRVIARTGVGLDSIDITTASARYIPVLYAPDAGTLPIAEGTIALIFATTKRLLELQALVTDGRWHHRYECDIQDLAGSTLGVIGFGRIGSEVGRLGLALGMNVVAYDPWQPDHDGDSATASIRRVSLDQLIDTSDILSLHCALNESSRGMINRDLLSRVKPGAVLINASRGGLIESDEVLLEALNQGWLSTIGLDVFGEEPPAPNSALLADPRVVSTPHAVGLTRSWNERVFTSLASDVRRVLDGELPECIANPEILGRASVVRL